MLEKIYEMFSNWRWRALDPNLRRGTVSYGIYGTGIGASKVVAQTAPEPTDVAMHATPVLNTLSGHDPLTLLDLFPGLAQAGYLTIASDGSLFILGISATQFASVTMTLISIVFVVIRFIGDFALWIPSWKIKQADLEELRTLSDEIKKEKEKK